MDSKEKPALSPMMRAVKEHGTFFMMAAIVLVLLEIQIFAIAVTRSGQKSTLEILNDQGDVIYRTDGARLSTFDKKNFEETFGPFDQHETRLVAKDEPFPFRAWFFAAVGLPIGAVLIIAFVFTAFSKLFYAEEPKSAEKEAGAGEETGFLKLLTGISRLNVFLLGGLVFVAVFGLWAVPNLLTWMGRTSLSFVSEYKWVFVAFFAVLLSLLVWIVYLRYLLAKKNIETRAEVEKHRIHLMIRQMDAGQTPVEIAYEGDDPGTPPERQIPSPPEVP